MAEVSTTPTPEVAEVNTSFDDKLAAKLGLAEPAPELEPKAADEAMPEGELAPDDLPAEEVDPNEFEITHNGKPVKLSKEEAKRQAQLGYDYTQKTQALAEERKVFEANKAALQAKSQITPQVIDAAANVRYFERALQQWQSHDWGKQAQEDPIGYIGTRAQFDQLREGYQQSINQFNQASQAVQQVEQQISTADLQVSLNKVMEAAPELRDPQKFTAETGRIRAYLTEQGVSQQRQDAMYDPVEFLIVRDAMRYRQALKAKAERQNPATPSLRPGPAPVRQSAETQKAELAKQLHQAKDPARKRELFDKLLAAKLGNR